MMIALALLGACVAMMAEVQPSSPSVAPTYTTKAPTYATLTPTSSTLAPAIFIQPITEYNVTECEDLTCFLMMAECREEPEDDPSCIDVCPSENDQTERCPDKVLNFCAGKRLLPSR